MLDEVEPSGSSKAGASMAHAYKICAPLLHTGPAFSVLATVVISPQFLEIRETKTNSNVFRRSAIVEMRGFIPDVGVVARFLASVDEHVM